MAPGVAPGLVRKTALAEILRVSTKTLTRKEHGRLLPTSRPVPGSQTVYYRLSDVRSALISFRIPDAVNGVDLFSSMIDLPTAWLTSMEVGAILGTGRPMVLRWTREESIPHFHLGRKCLRFIEQEIRAWALYQERERGVYFVASSSPRRRSFEKWLNNTKTKGTK